MQPPTMGGMSFDVPPHTHSHEDAVEDLANTVGASRDAVRGEMREEDSSSEAEESTSEDEDEDEDVEFSGRECALMFVPCVWNMI